MKWRTLARNPSNVVMGFSYHRHGGRSRLISHGGADMGCQVWVAGVSALRPHERFRAPSYSRRSELEYTQLCLWRNSPTDAWTAKRRRWKKRECCRGDRPRSQIPIEALAPV